MGAWKAASGRLQMSYESGAAEIFAQLTTLYDNDPEVQEATPEDLPPSYQESFEQVRQQLEGLGFEYLGSVKSFTAARLYRDQFPIIGIFRGEGGAVIAATQALFGHRTVSLTTEFDDGRVVTTSNSEIPRVWTYPPGFDGKVLPFETPLESLIAQHRDRTAAPDYQQLTPRAATTLTEVIEADQRRTRIVGRFRASLGYLTREELEGLMIRKDQRDQLLDPLWLELQRLVAAHRRKG
jgi:hypothetical protein